MQTYVFIDASNLFYGGKKSLGFKIDYRKLKNYLERKYQAKRFLYFGGVEIYNFEFNYLKNITIPLNKLESHLINLIKISKKNINEANLMLLGRHLQRIKFYKKLEGFGYELHLKPVKKYYQDDGSTKRKANCDVDMCFYLMKEKENFNRVVVLSGDGDFLPVIKYLKDNNKEIFILARGERTAREIKRFAGGNFRDFIRLRRSIEFKKK